MSDVGKKSITFKNPVGVNNRERAKKLLNVHIVDISNLLVANTGFKRDSGTNRGFLRSDEVKKLVTIQKKLKAALK